MPERQAFAGQGNPMGDDMGVAKLTKLFQSAALRVANSCELPAVEHSPDSAREFCEKLVDPGIETDLALGARFGR
jgi:hypothetical protein